MAMSESQVFDRVRQIIRERIEAIEVPLIHADTMGHAMSVSKKLAYESLLLDIERDEHAIGFARLREQAVARSYD